MKNASPCVSTSAQPDFRRTLLGGSFAEPARTARRGERLLVGSEILRRTDDLASRRGAAEEVGLDLCDAAAAELDVAVALAHVAALGRLAAEPRDDVLGDHAGRVLREHS